MSLLDLDTAAEELGMKRERLLRKARALEIGHVRDGKFYRFAAEHLEAWKREHEVHPTPEGRDIPAVESDDVRRSRSKRTRT